MPWFWLPNVGSCSVGGYWLPLACGSWKFDKGRWKEFVLDPARLRVKGEVLPVCFGAGGRSAEASPNDTLLF